jgi:hypothetical protein
MRTFKPESENPTTRQICAAPLPVPFSYIPAPPPVPLSYSVKGAMAATGLGRSVIFQLMADQKLERVKIGKRTVIPHASLMALISGKAA